MPVGSTPPFASRARMRQTSPSRLASATRSSRRGKLAAALRNHPLGPWLCAALAALTFAGMALLRWPLAWVLPALGGVACVLTWRKIAP